MKKIFPDQLVVFCYN